jgi:hypothetical protein
MKLLPSISLVVALLCGCTPRAQPQAANAAPAAQGAPAPVRTAVVQAAAPVEQATSYEVSIASAQADRVHARDQCDSKPKVARPSCFQQADAVYDQLKSAAEKVRDSGH